MWPLRSFLIFFKFQKLPAVDLPSCVSVFVWWCCFPSKVFRQLSGLLGFCKRMNWADLELGILYGLTDVMQVVANTPTKQFVCRVDDSCLTCLPTGRGQTGCREQPRIRGQLGFLVHVGLKTGLQDGGDWMWKFTHKWPDCLSLWHDIYF